MKWRSKENTIRGNVVGNVGVFATPEPARAIEACESDAFLIAKLHAEAEASTGQLARKIATEATRDRAWQILLDRLVLGGQDAGALRNLDALSMVHFTRVARETVLSNRYIAKLDYCFDRQLVRGLFRENSIAYAEFMSERIMLLPIFIKSGRGHLWRKPNPWKESMEKILPEHRGLVRLRIPRGFAIERSISGEGILTEGRAYLTRAAELDTAAMVLVSTAEVQSGILVVAGTLYHRDGRKLAEISELRIGADGNISRALDRLAVDFVEEIEQVWKQANRVDLERETSLRVSVAVESLEQWFGLEAKLKRLAPIERIDLRRLSASEAIMDMALIGSRDTLDYALEAAGYALSVNQNAEIGGYVLEANR